MNAWRDFRKHLPSSGNKTDPQVHPALQARLSSPATNTSSSNGEPQMYKYAPLKKNHIRILDLLQGSGDDPIRVKIQHWDVHDERERAYAALSYTWGGDPKVDRQVVYFGSRRSNKHFRYVTNNLMAFLKRIRQPGYGTCVWADALCIDQGNEKEKAEQVGLMTLIYPQAVQVLVWLGEPGEEDALVAEAFRGLEAWASAYSNKAEQTRLAGEPDMVGGSSFAGACAALFARPWFRRAWIVQEVMVDFKKPPLVLCGLHEISWHRVWTALFGIFATLLHDGAAELCGVNVRHLLPLLQMTWSPEEDMSLTNIVPRMSLREASLPQDRMFAMFGLAERSGVRYPAPDYSLSVRDVSMIYTRAIIATDKRLAMLSYVDPSPGPDRLPSWTLKLGRTELTRDSQDIIAQQDMTTYSHQFHATLQQTPVVEPAVSSTTPDPYLRMRGLPLDRIVRVHLVRDVLIHMTKDICTWVELVNKIEWCCAVCLGLPLLYPSTGESTTRAFMRALTQDRSLLCSKAALLSEDRWLARRQLHVAYVQHVKGVSSEPVQSTANKPTTELLSEEDLAEHVYCVFQIGERSKGVPGIPGFPYDAIERYLVADLVGSMTGVPKRRVIFITAGGLLGISCWGCYVRDEIWLLPGANVPFVLKPQLNLRSKATPVTHKLIGDAFVHGIMYGEAMAGYEAKVKRHGEEGAARSLMRCCLV
ncbi:hypothetical protein LTR29_011057 [Friedmanniomyces endolithicus]|nr:hypothetical protein LTR29_011057 [Friedmanniomyces endolithicus]